MPALDPRAPRDGRLRPGRQLHPRQRPLGLPRRPPAAPAGAAHDRAALRARTTATSATRSPTTTSRSPTSPRWRAPSTRSSSRSRPRRTSRRPSTWAGPASSPTRRTRSTSSMAEDLGPASMPPDERRGRPRPSSSRYHAERLAAWEGGAARGLGVLDGARLGAARRSPTAPALHHLRLRRLRRARTTGRRRRQFTEERFWLRARLEMGGYVKPPRIVRILDQRRRRLPPHDHPRRDPRLVRRHAAAELRAPAAPAARGRGDRGARAPAPAARRAARAPRGGRRGRGRAARARRRRRVLGALAAASRASSSPGRAAGTTASTTRPARSPSATAGAA